MVEQSTPKAYCDLLYVFVWIFILQSTAVGLCGESGVSVVLHAGVDSRCADVPVLIHRHQEVALIAWETAARLNLATAIYVLVWISLWL